jgi:DNA-directed RNA polymerase specialized sigma24 family protein
VATSRPDPSRYAAFPTTHWSRVIAAGDPAAPEARDALAELCDAYWYPIYAFIRRRGHGRDDARDLTQVFFARLLENRAVAAADRARGRFRAFLLADCRFFLADARDRADARKRGRGVRPFALDARNAETRYDLEPANVETPEHLFERAWALALLERATAAVAKHDADTGRTEGRPLIADGGPAKRTTPRPSTAAPARQGPSMTLKATSNRPRAVHTSFRLAQHASVWSAEVAGTSARKVGRSRIRWSPRTQLHSPSSCRSSRSGPGRRRCTREDQTNQVAFPVRFKQLTAIGPPRLYERRGVLQAGRRVVIISPEPLPA